MTDVRFQALLQWCRQQLSDTGLQLEVVSGDASFRRYFRTLVPDNSRTCIAVDAPPEKENSDAFIAIDGAFLSHGVRVPGIIAKDTGQGFMLLDDFGDKLLLDALTADSVDGYYSKAMDSLNHLKDCTRMPDYSLPLYDETLLRDEMMLFPDWFINRHLQLDAPEFQVSALQDLFGQLISSALAQPQVCVHRDFHSRNIMLLESDELGIIDFQDAVLGPVTYDLVSLLKDCYISWPRHQVLGWVEDYYHKLAAQQLPGLGDLQQFIKWFDLMGIQRHLKAIGIFARLNHRDNKPGYLGDIPRTLNHIVETCRHYPELMEFGLAIETLIVPLVQPHTRVSSL